MELGRTQQSVREDSPAFQRLGEDLQELLDPTRALAYVNQIKAGLATRPQQDQDELAAFDDVTGEIDEAPTVVTLSESDSKLFATTLWLCGPAVELPTITLLDTCSQVNLVDKTFLHAARPDISWRPVTETIRLEGVGNNISDQRPRK